MEMEIFLLLNILSKSYGLLDDNGPNRCWNNTEQLYYCCSDFEEINGSCSACKIGFTSFNGQRCSKCKKNHYGGRCLSKCHCELEQRCDHILGCVALYYDIFDQTTNHSRSDSEATFGYSKMDLLLYLAVATSVFLIFSLFLIIYTFKKHKGRRHAICKERFQESNIEAEVNEHRGERFVMQIGPASHIYQRDETKMIQPVLADVFEIENQSEENFSASGPFITKIGDKHYHNIENVNELNQCFGPKLSTKPPSELSTCEEIEICGHIYHNVPSDKYADRRKSTGHVDDGDWSMSTGHVESKCTFGEMVKEEVFNDKCDTDTESCSSMNECDVENDDPYSHMYQPLGNRVTISKTYDKFMNLTVYDDENDNKYINV